MANISLGATNIRMRYLIEFFYFQKQKPKTMLKTIRHYLPDIQATCIQLLVLHVAKLVLEFYQEVCEYQQ